MPVIGAMLEALSGACRQVPQKKTPQHTSTSASDTIMQSLRPAGPKRTTSVSTPMCEFSRATTTAPTKVSQTNRNRDSSSESAIPESKA